MRLRRIAVVVPARNEEELLAACLDSVSVAEAELARVRPDVVCEVMVVLDRCTDGTADVAIGRRARVVSSRHGRVGAARALGVRTALDGHRPDEVWIANTDADSVVPPHWLVRQAELAEDGHDLVTGTVEPGPTGDPVLLAQWHARHRLADDHPYVHAANLGIRGSAYLRAGGFDDVATHEDRLLVERAVADGIMVTASDALRVRTSGRLESRAPGGFADYLQLLICPAEPGSPGETGRRGATLSALGR